MRRLNAFLAVVTSFLSAIVSPLSRVQLIYGHPSHAGARVLALRHKGEGMRKIARTLGIGNWTVQGIITAAYGLLYLFHGAVLAQGCCAIRCIGRCAAKLLTEP